MKCLIIVLIIFTPSLCSAAGPMNFLCTVEETTGYVWRNEKWETHSFKDSGAKYIASIEDQTLTEFGDSDPIFKKCEGDNVFLFACPRAGDDYKFIMIPGSRFIRRFTDVNV